MPMRKWKGRSGMTAIDFSSFVDQLATASGDTILPFFRTALAVENKKAGGFDPVTAADRAAEQSMRALIRKQFPDHGILGEEYGSEHTDAEYVWVLDPIDGTKSFISGMLAWGTLIGLMRFGEPVFGMMNQPFTRERFSGDGGAAHYRGPAGKRDLHVRECASLEHALMSTTSPLLMAKNDRAAFGKLEDKVKLSRYGGDCYAYCMSGPRKRYRACSTRCAVIRTTTTARSSGRHSTPSCRAPRDFSARESPAPQCARVYRRQRRSDRHLAQVHSPKS